MNPRTTSTPRVLAAIPLAALAVVGSLTVAGQSGVAPVPSAAARHPRPAPTPAPQPLAPVAVVPAAQDAATAWHGKARTARSIDHTTSEIPAPALAAYQRAATTIDAAAPTCHLDWSFLAAIGKVESNDGGGHLTAQGVAQPAIIGPALTGQNATALVTDTDGGLYDGDTTYDHAVGPMQILPATWASVGVDANGDGKRDPQDIDDAALAAAVFLCSGGGDLSTPDGQHAAALRYNPAQWYADSVVAIAHAYATSTPVASFVSAVFIPARTAAPGEIIPLTPVKHRPHHHTGTAASGTAGGPGGGSTTTAAPSSAPAAGPSNPPSTAPSTPPAATPTPDPATTAPSTPAAPAAPATPAPATTEQLQTMCSTAIAKAYPDATSDVQQQATDACLQKLTGKTPDDAQAALPDVVSALPHTFPALMPAPTSSPSDTTAPAPTSGPAGPATDPATDPSAAPAS